MDEKALEVAYRLFVKDGYNKSIGDFKTLISTNPKALDVSHKLFVKDGYNGDISKYKNLLGVGELETIGTPEIKKKEQVTELPSKDGSLGSENATKPLPKKGVSLGSEKPKPEAPIPNINDNSYGDVQPKPLEFRPFIKDKPILKPTQQVTPKQDLQNRLKTITPELIGKEEKFVVPELNYQFKDQGFKFEEATPMADAMNVTAPNGKVLKIDLDPFTTSGEVMESNKLKKFISENSIDYDKINKVSQQQSEYKKRFIDQKEIESANQRFNDEIKLFDYELQQLNLLQKGTPEYTKKANELAIAQNKLVSNQKELNKSAGKYVEMKESQGTYLGYLRNQLIGGITGAASGLAGLVLDVSALPDAAKKQAKAFIQPGIRESLDYFKDETTKEYAESLNFVGEAIGGLVQSLPAMLAGEGLPIIMAGQISDGLDQEMKTNPDFENVSELEKLALKTPMIVGGALLEKYGLRNVVQSKGLLNNIVLNAIGKSSKNTTVKSFEDFLEQEIKDKFTRGVLKVGAGGLAEFETGASQELLDITTKDIYNAVKEKKMFQTPETFGEKVGQVFKAGRQEAIGGFILSVPSAISATKGDYTKLNNATIDVLKATGNDATIGQMIETDLKMKVNSGDLTPDEAETQLNDFRESVGVLNSINTEGMTPEQVKRALPIAKKLRDLKNRTDGKVNQTEADKFAINELKVSLDKITNEVKGQTPVADLIDKKVSFQGEEGVIVKDEGGKLTFETPNKIIELQGDEMANAIALPKIEVKGNNVKIDDELFNILSTNKNDNGDVVSVTLRNKEGQVITNKDADLATGISKQFKNKKDAIQEQTTEESVLRNQQPEMGLQEMGEGNIQETPEQGKTKEIAGSVGVGGDVKLEKGNKIQWNVFGNEESGEWTVGETTKTRGGKDAVVLTKVYVEASSNGKSYTKEYADANGIKYDNERTVEHIVPLEDLQSLKETPKEEVKPFSIDNKTKFYHATPSKIEGKLKVSNAPQFGTGIYLASDKKTVEGEFGDNVMELELNLSNPVYTNTKNWNEVESEAIRLADEEYGKKNNLTLGEDDTYFRYDPENLSEIDEIPSKHISDAAKKLGYDAIVDKGSRTYGDEIVVLDESKIIYPKPIKKQNNETENENGIQKRGTQGNENVPGKVQGQREKRGEDVNVPESKTKEEVKPTELQTKISSLQDKIETIKKGKEGKSQILQKIADTAISDLQKKLNILINKQNEAETKAKAKAKKADVLKGKPKSAVVETAAEKVKVKPTSNKETPKAETSKTKIYHGADIDFTIEGKRNRIMFTSKDEGYAKYYAKQRGGKVFEFDIDDNKVATEEYVKNKIKSLGLKTQEGGDIEIEDNLHRLIDPRFDDTAISKEGLDTLFSELEKEGYYGVEFMDENQELGGMNEIESIAIFNPKELTKKTESTKKSISVIAETKESTNETKELEKQLEEAQNEISALSDKIKTKSSELGKTFMEDQSDLFGKRQSDKDKLFSQRVNPDNIKKVISNLKKQRDIAILKARKIQENIDKSKTKKESQQNIFKEKPVTNPRANKGEDVIWKDVNGKRGQGTVISVSKVGNSFEYEIKTKQGAVTTKKHSEIKKKGIGVLANTIKKYSNLDVLTPRTLILRYFATGGKVLYGTKQQDGALSQTGYAAEDLFGFISKNGRTYSQLYENIMDELQLEDFDQGDFNTMVSEILQGGKQSVYDEIKTHLVGEAKDLDDPINWSYNELLEVAGNENFPNREWIIEQIGEQERAIVDELSETELAELDKNIEKYTVNGITDWDAIANDNEVQQLESNKNENTENLLKGAVTKNGDSTPIGQEEKTGQQEIENIKENESNYILTPNKDLPFLSESGNDNYPTKGDLQREEDNSQGYSRSIIGVWNKTKDLQFTGTTKVRNAEDVAHIMRLLENKNVEHGFAVHVDAKGNSHIQYLSVGGTTGTVIDSKLVLAGLAKFKSKKVYLVHNHPSGALVPSKPDISITQTLQSALGKLDIDLEHVIMDTYSNKYVLLDKDADFTVEDRNKDLEDNSNLTVHVFNEQKVISIPQTKVTSSKTAAEFIQQLRFTAMPKNAMLVLSQNNDIIGNYVFKDKITYQECVDFIGKSGIGTSVIFYGNQQRESEAREVSDFLKKMSVNVLDHIITDSNGSDVVGYYRSLGEEGMLEETQAEYGTNSVSEPNVEIIDANAINKVLLHTNIQTLKGHPHYKKAKSGNVKLAYLLSVDLIKPEKLFPLKENPTAIIVPVRAIEQDGVNAIPLAMAKIMSEISGNKIDLDIYQSNKPKHTGKSKLARMTSPPEFLGKIQKGLKYFLVDDVATSGSTLNNLKNYIEDNGGIVVGSTAIAVGRGGGKIGITDLEVKKINAKFGKSNINTFLKEYGIAESSEKLTSSQANDLLRFGTIDKIRNKLLVEGIGKARERVKRSDSEKQQNKITESEISSNLAAKIRSKKLSGLGVHLDFGITKTIYNGALEIAAREVEKGSKLGNAINKAIAWVDSKIGKKWNKGLFAKHLNDKYKVTLNGKEVEVEIDNSKPTAELINGFYSPLEAGINKSKLDKATGKEWLKRLQGETESDELKWTGVADYLTENSDKIISKNNLLDYFKTNRIEIVEVVKSDAMDKSKFKAEQTASGNWDVFHENTLVRVVYKNEASTAQEAIDIIIEEADMDYQGEFGDSKFSEKQLEGEKSNYKEVLVTLPVTEREKTINEKDKKTLADYVNGIRELNEFYANNKRFNDITAEDDLDYVYIQYVDERNDDILKKIAFDDIVEITKSKKAAKEYIEKRSKFIKPIDTIGMSTKANTIGSFSSSHFDEPNILVHLRMNTRTDAQGNKVLFLEEVQSDWGQTGKKEGFATNEKPKEVKVKDLPNLKIEEEDFWDSVSISASEPNSNISRALGRVTNIGKNKYEAVQLTEQGVETKIGEYRTRKEATNAILESKIFEGADKKTISAIPSAPFVMDTNAWTKLGLKVALKEAIKQGADKIAWTTGEQQNDRYDLSKSVKRVDFIKVGEDRYKYEALDLNSKRIAFDDNGTTSLKDIENMFGKDIAEKVKADKKGDLRLEGEGLKVGGKGMKGFYGSPTEGKLGIVGEVARSLTGQSPKTIEINKGKNEKLKAYQYDGTQDVSGMMGRDYLKKGDWIIETPSGFQMSFDTKSKEDALREFRDATEDTGSNVGEYSESTQYSIDITPELKESVESGIPLFKGLTPKEQSKQRIEAAKKAFIEKSKNMSSGGFQALPEFVELIKSYIADGIITAKEFIERFKDELPGVDLNEKLAVTQFDKIYKKATTVVDETTEEVKKTIATSRVYEGNVRAGVKRELEKLGLTRDVENQQEAKERAIEFVNTVGVETALEAVRNNDVSDAAGAYVWNEILERLDRKISKEKDSTKLAELEKEQAGLFNEFSRKALSGGRFSSALADIYQNSDIGYNVENKIQEYRDANNGQISEEVEEKFRELDAQYKEVKQKLAEAEERAIKAEGELAIKNIQEAAARTPKQKVTVSSKIRTETDWIVSRVKEAQLNRPGMFLSATPASLVWDGAVKIVAGTIKVTGRSAEAIAKGLEHIVKSDWYKSLSDSDKKEAEKQFSEFWVNKETIPGIAIKIPNGLIRRLVEEGATTIEEVVEGVKDVIKEEYPDITDREIRDAITQYGKIKNLSKDEILASIRKIKRIGRIVSALEDVNNKKRPLRSGLQRDKLDAQERALNKELRELMKELPIDAELEAKQQKTALDATKQRITNQIEDLQREIDKGMRVPLSKRSMAEDAELTNLKEKRDKLKIKHDEIFKDESFLQAKRLDATKKASQRAINDLRRRLKEKDFTKKEKSPLIKDSELFNLQAEKLRLREEYDKEIYKAKLNNRTKAEKTIDALWNAWGLTRLLRATGEFSFVGIQGLVLSISNPTYALKSFMTAMKFFGSESRTENWLNMIKSQEWYPEMRQSKLSISEPRGEATAREELFLSDAANFVWNILGSALKLKSKSAYDNWKRKSPFKAFERAAVGYLDTMRVLKFLDGREMLHERGIRFENDPQAFKDLADVVNTFTGRASIGPLEQIAPTLTKVFFSPRNWASALKQTILFPRQLYKWRNKSGTPGVSIANKIALLDYSKFIGLTMGLVIAAAMYYNDDDDDETGVETDPTSSDFGKIKIGNTRVDPWGGRIQQIVFLARMIAGSMLKGSGEVVKLGTPYRAPTRLGLIGEQATNKLAPSASMIQKFLTTHEKNGVTVDQWGNPYSITEELKKNSYPIYWDTVKDLLQDDPTALDGLLAFYAFFGGGVNVYDKKTKPLSNRPIKELKELKEVQEVKGL